LSKKDMGIRGFLPCPETHSTRFFRHRAPASVYERIYDAVRQIPRGKVATYGQIAKIVDRCTPRMVGYAMAALRGRTDVPWQRVINAKGEISTRSGGDGAVRQRRLLEKEGICFDRGDRVDFKKYRWRNREKTEDAFRP
jgi:methylated-DNA-protein-cysteine methyltransferase related protein